MSVVASMWRPTTTLVLASASPRRRDLLAILGLSCLVDPADVDESSFVGEEPSLMVKRLALAKARLVSSRHESAWVIAADTVVVLDGMILGKPIDSDDACRMLGLMSGRTHQVATGYAIVGPKEVADPRPEVSAVEYADVTLGSLTPGKIAQYVATGEPLDKAGSYALQGVGAAFVRNINGSHSTVIGLPLAQVTEALADLGAIRLAVS